MNIEAVSIKLPQFWPTQVMTWFTQAEAQFAIRGITSEQTKYYHVVASLDQDTAQRISHTLVSPPSENMYSSLKAQLLGTFELSEDERGYRLLNLSGLGDRKPSQLMDEMLGLLGDSKPCFVFRSIFLSHMPDDVRLALSTSEFSDPRQLALVADRIWTSKYGANTSHVNTIARIKEPKKETSSRQLRDDAFCFYHRKFGKLARKCVAPCSFSGKDKADHQ